MITVKNRYQKVIYRIKNGEVVNQGGNKIASVGEGHLLNAEGEVVANIEGQQVKNPENEVMMAQLSGTKVTNQEGEVIGYVDGKPFSQFGYGAAVLAVFTY